MGKYGHIKISLMLFFLAVIGVSLSSCMIFFMGDFREFLIDEDFNDGIANNWMPDGTAGISWWVDAGEYRMDNATLVFNYTNSYYNERLLDNRDHFSYQATIRQYSGDTASNQCGLIFRSDDPWKVNADPPPFSGYLLRIEVYNGTGSYWALERYDAGAMNTLMSGSNNPNINDLFGDTNVIKVKCEGSHIEVYFNGNYINSFEDGSYMGGHVGLFAYTSNLQLNSFAFDDVELWIPREYQD